LVIVSTTGNQFITLGASYTLGGQLISTIAIGAETKRSGKGRDNRK
jgi:hypothetical protein